MFWILSAGMTAAAVLAVVWPLARRKTDTRSGSDIEVYRDQLDEIDRDLKFGLIGAAEAEAARIEVSRRLIAAAEMAGTITIPQDDAAIDRRRGRRFRKKNPSWRRVEEKEPSRRLRLVIGAAAVMLICVGTFSVYLKVGSPNLPGQPIAGRVAAAQRNAPSTEQPATSVARTSQTPEKMAEREADVGEALVAAANGIVTAEAKAAFDRSFRLDGANVSARFYIGLAAEQDGRNEEAARIWRKLLADSPPGAPWRPLVQTALERVEPGAASIVRKPDLYDSAPAVANAAPEQREKMIRAMVDRLAARLRQDSSDVDGWIQLVRSYVVLKDSENARAAIAEARRTLAGDPDKLRHLDNEVSRLGMSARP